MQSRRSTPKASNARRPRSTSDREAGATAFAAPAPIASGQTQTRYSSATASLTGDREILNGTPWVFGDGVVYVGPANVNDPQGPRTNVSETGLPEYVLTSAEPRKPRTCAFVVCG